MDLATTYLGLDLPNPLVAAPSPLQQTPGGVVSLVDAGVGAVVLYSLFAEQIRQQLGPDPGGTPSRYFANPAGPGGPARYLELVSRAADSVDVPVIASLNGTETGAWTAYARELQDAGAAALELNFYVVPGQFRGSGLAVEDACVDLLVSLTEQLRIPVAVKLPPFFSAFHELAARLDRAGAAGLVLFNRFLQPRIDTTSLTVEPVIEPSSPAEARLPQTWIAVLRHQVACCLAGTGGVDSGEDLAAYLLAGADVVQCASAFLRHGRDHARTLLRELTTWGDAHGFTQVGQVRGRLAMPGGGADDAFDRAEFEREGYLTALQVARRAYVWR